VLSAEAQTAVRVERGDAGSARRPMSRPEADAGPFNGDSERWLTGLRDEGVRGDATRAKLHELLLRAARFEIKRQSGTKPHIRGGDFDDLAHQAAADAMVAILAKLDTYRGDSRFTTWAYKFALLEAAVKLRRRAWQGREVPLEPEDWSVMATESASPETEAESREVLRELTDAIETELSPHQRRILLGVAVNGVPIDVLAERLNTTRGALYKTIHDARRKLRTHLAEASLRFVDELEKTGS
jgi:RNA polymerase sigma-70 factor (ECF subfamily)